MTSRLKTIGIHILFWILYIIIWGVRDMVYAPTFLDTVDSNLIGSAFYASGVYLNIYILVPKLLLRKQQAMYLLATAASIVLVAFASSQTFAVYYQNVHGPTSDFFGSIQGTVNEAGDFLIVLFLALSIYFINQWYVKDRRINELETTSLKAELNLLKGQINPHFLFNALNSIHVLIKKDSDLAQQTLEKFSEILSHQLYDISNDEILLEDEIKILTNFIELQKLRYQDRFEVHWDAKGEFQGKLIAPMLFLNFVENAFKYASNHKVNKAKIELLLTVSADVLNFSCVNDYESYLGNNGKLGMGIANARRRLELIYPNKHLLEIEKGENKFSVNLNIRLHEN